MKSDGSFWISRIVLIFSLTLCVTTFCGLARSGWTGSGNNGGVGPLCAISPDSTLMCFSGQQGLAVYTTVIPPTLLASKELKYYPVSFVPPLLPCFAPNSSSVFFISRDSVVEYSATSLQFKQKLLVNDPQNWLATVLEDMCFHGIPVVWFDTTRHGFIVRPRTMTQVLKDSLQYRKRCVVIQRRDSTWDVQALDSVYMPTDAGSTVFSCVKRMQADSVDVINILTRRTVGTFLPISQALSCCSDGKHVIYSNTKDSIVLLDLATNYVVWSTQLYSSSGYPYSNYSSCAEITILNDSMFCYRADSFQFYSLHDGHPIYNLTPVATDIVCMPKNRTLCTFSYNSAYSRIFTDCESDEMPSIPAWKDSWFRILDEQCDELYNSTADSVLPNPLAVEFSPGETTMAFRENYSLTKIVDAKSGRVQCRIRDTGVFCSSGTEFLCIGIDSTRVYSTSNGALLRTLAIPSISGLPVISVNNSDGVFALADNDSLRLYSVVAGSHLASFIIGGHDRILQLQYSAGDSVLVCTSKRGRLYRVHPKSMSVDTVELESIDPQYKVYPPSALSRDASTVACVASSHNDSLAMIQVFATKDGKWRCTYFTHENKYGYYCNVGLSSNGRMLLIDRIQTLYAAHAVYFDIFDTHFSKVVHSTSSSGGSSNTGFACAHHLLSPSGDVLCSWKNCSSPVSVVAAPDSYVPEIDGARGSHIQVRSHANSICIQPVITPPSSYSIYNVLGGVMWTWKVSSMDAIDVTTSSWANGVYYLVASYGQRMETISLVVSR